MTSFFGAGGLERFSGHWRQGEGTLAAAVLAGRGSARGRGWRPLAETAAHSLRGLVPASTRPFGCPKSLVRRQVQEGPPNGRF